MAVQQTFEDIAGAFPLEVQLKAAREMWEYWQARAGHAERRRIPPERKELEELQERLAQAQRLITSERRNAEVWKKVAGEMSDRIDAIKGGTDTARLERERDHWRDRWRAAIQRIGHLLEHQGSVEYLERQINELEQANARLRGPF